MLQFLCLHYIAVGYEHKNTRFLALTPPTLPPAPPKKRKTLRNKHHMSTYYKTSCSVLRNSRPKGGGKGVMISPVGWLTSLANKSKLRPVRAGSHLSAIMTRNLFNLNDLPWPVSLRSHCSHITGPNNTNANQQQSGGGVKLFMKCNCFLPDVMYSKWRARSRFYVCKVGHRAEKQDRQQAKVPSVAAIKAGILRLTGPRVVGTKDGNITTLFIPQNITSLPLLENKVARFPVPSELWYLQHVHA